MLSRPLELAKVAELKYSPPSFAAFTRALIDEIYHRALLPEMVKFAYTPRLELRIHSDQQPGSSRRARSPDFSEFRTAGTSSSRVNDVDEDEHVLVLDFIDNSRGTKTGNAGFAYALPPALTPAATKKLVERRNSRFVEAVNE